MRTFALIIAAWISLSHLCSANPIVVAISPGPERHFELVLSTDKDQPGYDKLENNAVPKVLLRHRLTGKALAEFDFPADPNSDEQPLRDHLSADWSPSGTLVAIKATERHYSHLLVFAFKGTYSNPDSFVKVDFPGVGELIQAAVPKFKEFRSRWHSTLQGWPGPHLVMFSSGSDAITFKRADDDVSFHAVYSFTFDVTDPAAPVLRRMELTDD